METPGYIKLPKQIKCHKKLYEEMQILLKEINIYEYNFLCHIVYSFRMNLNTYKNEDNWIEIHSRTLRKYIPSFQKKNRDKLIKIGLLEYDEVYAIGNKCYCYHPGPRLLEIIYCSFEVSLNNIVSNERYTLKGKKSNAGRKKQPMKNIPFNRMNIKAMDELNTKLEVEAKLCSNNKKQKRLKTRLLRNKVNLSLIDNIIEYDEENGVLTYIPEYEDSSTGRMYEVGGGQSMTREMKAAAYSLDNVFNYDLRSSQLCILLEVSSRYGGLSEINISTLTSYIKDKQKKYEYAEKANVPVDLWKKGLMSILFGGSFGDQSELWEDVKRWLEEEQDRDLTKKDINPTVEHLKCILKPFIKVKDEWLGIVRAKFTSKIGETFTNDAKKQYTITKDTAQERRKFSAFLLQGLEAAFIQEIINLSDIFDYEVYSNEHDGVVTYGEIPEEAITLAKHKTGFKLAKLEIKPIL